MSTKPASDQPKSERRGWLFPTAVLVVTVVLVGYVAYSALPWGHARKESTDAHADTHADAHTGDHDHEAKHSAGSESGDTLVVSPQAEKNINMTTVPVKLEAFQRTVTIPGRVVEQPGHSRIEVSSPMTGIVEQIFTIRGEAIRSGEKLFQIRLTHEEAIGRQANLLKLVQQLDIVHRELERLEEVTASGAVAGKTLLNVQYEAQKLEVDIDAEKQGLLLLGLTQKQVDEIVSKKRLVRTTIVTAPEVQKQHGMCECEHLLQVSQINASVGQQVEAGKMLGVLADYCLLLIEGQALEQDGATLSDAVQKKLPLTATVEQQGKKIEIPDLQILFLDSEVNVETRALRFYVTLPNEISNDVQSPVGRQFIEWKFRPGQRVELFLPIESWPDCIVLPREAVIRDGIESIVFVKQGTKITRKPVVESYHDARVSVLANDGTLFPGEEVVVNGAYPLFLKMKNRDKPIDPHAGHHH